MWVNARVAALGLHSRRVCPRDGAERDGRRQSALRKRASGDEHTSATWPDRNGVAAQDVDGLNVIATPFMQ